MSTPDLYFFIDPADLISQTTGEIYGPVHGNETNAYRSSAVFNINTNSMAFAVTDGEVIIQPQFDPVTSTFSSTHVNLILKPFSQPLVGMPLVKFFIYRGLKKSDFLVTAINQGTNLPEDAVLPKDDPNNPTNSDLINQLWSDLEVFMAPSPIGQFERPSPVRLGWDLKENTNNNNHNEDLSIDEIFHLRREIYSTSLDTYLGITYAHVKKGMTLGHFLPGRIGFDIVLEGRLGHTITLKDARKGENIIDDVASIGTGDVAGNLSISMMREREKILAFIDPIAYYIALYNHKIGIKSIDSNGVVSEIWAGVDDPNYPDPLNSVYTQVASKFKTKNRLYIDCRNEYGYSINYMKDNHGDVGAVDEGKHIDLVIGGTQEKKNYYRDFWPLYYVDLDSPYYPGPGVNKQEVVLSFRKEHNPQPVIYADYALDDSLAPLQNSRSFLVDEAMPTTTWSDFFSFYTPHIVNGETPSWYMKLFVNRREVPQTIPATAFKRENYLDNVFGPINFLPKLNVDYSTKWFSGQGKKYINALDELGIECMVELSVGLSNDHVEFKANILSVNLDVPDDLQIAPTSFLITPNGEGGSDSTMTSYQSQISRGELSIVVEVGEGSSSTKIITSKSKRSSWANSSFYVNPQEFSLGTFSLVFSKSEFETNILNAALNLDSSLHDLYINFNNLEAVKGSELLKVQNDIIYQSPDGKTLDFDKTLIYVSGFNNLGVYQTIGPIGGNIVVKSLDRMRYSSENAAETLINDNNVSADPCSLRYIPNPYIELNDLISYIEKVEDTYSTVRDYTDSIEADSVLDTATRIRVHHYGRYAHYDDGLFGWAASAAKARGFENCIRHSNYEENTQDSQFAPPSDDLSDPSDPMGTASPGTNSRHRRLFERELMEGEDCSGLGKEAFSRLSAQADENEIADNPGPMLLIENPSIPGVPQQIDIGHLFYAFEAMARFNKEQYPDPDRAITFTFENPPNDTGIGEGFMNYGIFHPFDLAGLIGDIGITAAEFFFHENQQKVPSKAPYYPTVPDLDRYFDISSPEADLLSDVDGTCLYVAYEVLKHCGDNLRLSDVLKLYYQGESSLSPELTVNTNSPFKFFTVENRWLIFCSFWGFIEQISENTYNWLPVASTVTPSATWQPIRDAWRTRMRNFMEMWTANLKSFIEKSFVGLQIAYNFQESWLVNPLLFNEWMDLNITPNIEMRVNEIAGEVFEDKFLMNYAKTELINELNIFNQNNPNSSLIINALN